MFVKLHEMVCEKCKLACSTNNEVLKVKYNELKHITLI